ncbi:hypothetical protein BH23GEM4_BH23GEM4_21190 [soil metagenome]
MLIQEVRTELPAGEVIERARRFFTLQFSPYAGFTEDAGDSHIRFTTEAGELVIGVGERDGETVVRGSSSRMHHELGQFLATIGQPGDVRDNADGPGVSGGG